MSTSAPSTSGASGTSKNTSRVFVLTPEMLKKMGLSDQLKLIQSKIKNENTVKLIANTKKPVIKPKIIIPSNKVRIIKKKNDNRQNKSVGKNDNYGSEAVEMINPGISDDNKQQLNCKSPDKKDKIHQLIDIPNSESPNEIMRDKSSVQEKITSQNNLEDSEMTDLVKNSSIILEKQINIEKSVEDHIESELNRMNLIQSPSELMINSCGKDKVTEAADELMKILEETEDEYDPVEESITRTLSDVIIGESGASGDGETRGNYELSTVEREKSSDNGGKGESKAEESSSGVIRVDEEASGVVKALGDAPQVEIEMKKSEEVSEMLQSPIKKSNIRPLKPKPNISHQLPRGVMRNNKLETLISDKNDQLSSTNIKTSPESIVMSNESVNLKINNFDILMEAVDINLKQENAEKHDRLCLAAPTGSLDESPVINHEEERTSEVLEASDTPEKIEESKINVKSRRKRSLKLDLVQTMPAKVPRRSTTNREVLEIETGQKNSPSPVKVPEATPRSVRASRRQLKPKIFQDCIMWPSRTPRPSQYHEDMMVNLLISKKSTTKAKIIDESRSEFSEIEDFESKNQKFIINRVINGSPKPPVSRNHQEEVIIKSLVGQNSSITLESLGDAVSQSCELKKEIIVEEVDNEEKINDSPDELSKNSVKLTAIKPRKVISTKVTRRRTSLRGKSQINEENLLETSKRRSQTSRKINKNDNVPLKIKNLRRKAVEEEIILTPEPLDVIANSPAKSEENPVETPPEDDSSQLEISKEFNEKSGKINEIPKIIATSVVEKRGRQKGKHKSELEKLLPPPVIPHSVAPEEPKNLESHDDKTENIDTNHPRKPSNRPDEIDGKGLSESSSEASEPPDDPPPRRGRGRRGRGRGRGRGRAPIDREYTPRFSTASKHPPPRPSPSGSQSEAVKCAKCQEEMPNSAWSKHNLSKHNNMGWMDGESQPDFGDHKWLTSLLTKTKRKKPSLICESCGTSKKSVAGFISHITFCGKSEEEKQSLMWTCPQCKIILMPSSQEYHERQHREQELGIEKKKIVKLVVESDNSRIKRKAAEKAATKISEFTDLVKGGEEPPAKKRKLSARVLELIQPPQLSNKIPGVWKTMWTRSINHNEKAHCRQPGCNFSAPTLADICDHYSLCNFTPRPSYLCKICDFSNLSRAEVFKHVKDQHSSDINGDDSDYNASDDDSEDDYIKIDDDDGKSRGRKPGQPRPPGRPKAKFIINAMTYRNTPKEMTFSPILKWTVEFQNKYYRLYLFDDLRPNSFQVVGDSEDYLPKLKVSMQTALASPKKKTIDPEIHDWKRWDRFEADIVGVVPTFFTGGPIWALAWLPIPPPFYNKNANQYLAISTHPTMESTYEVGQCYVFKNSIQIWNIGHLAHDSAVPRVPELSYCVGHEEGTIWCLEWCPSGCYQDDTLKKCSDAGGMRRMGLLAAAMSSGAVHIYSLPFPEDLVKSKDKFNPKVFKTDPVMILHVNSESEGKSQCMTLTWSKTSDHDTIAAGYSDGYVAIWDLTTKSAILRSKIRSTVHLNSFMHFYAHGHAVMFVTIIPIEGKRYLATAGMDRLSKMWDLEDISKDFWCLKRGVGVNGTWMTHWPTMLTCYDDVLGLGHTQTYLASVREAAGKVMPMLPTNSPVFAIASSDWANGICQGTLAGEIVAIFPPQMLYTKEIDKLTRRRWLVTNVEVVDFEGEKEIGKKEYDYKPEGYEECQERFGVAFYDDLDNNRGAAWMNKHEKKGFLSAEVMSSVPVEQYPFTAINRISWNPNGWSHLWIAAGYRNGLVRVLNLKRMNKNSITVDMLSKHAASIRKKEEELKNS